jgi:chromosome segregation ATPase
MRTVSSVLAIVAFAVTAADARHEDLASVVIRSEVVMMDFYRPLDDSEDELIKKYSLDSALQLRYLILHESTDPELRICYALRILESQIASTSEALASIPAEYSHHTRDHLEMLLGRRKTLVGQLRSIQERKSIQELLQDALRTLESQITSTSDTLASIPEEHSHDTRAQLQMLLERRKRFMEQLSNIQQELLDLREVWKTQQTAEPGGPANQSQPVGPAINQTSPAAGSGG